MPLVAANLPLLTEVRRLQVAAISAQHVKEAAALLTWLLLKNSAPFCLDGLNLRAEQSRRPVYHHCSQDYNH